jgi:hypothetical protein
MLGKAGIEVERHGDHFQDDVRDEVWIMEAGRKKWFCVSRNIDIRYKRHETEAVMRANVGLFLVVGPKATHPELADNFILTYPAIQRFIAKHKRPFIAKIYRPMEKFPKHTSKPRGGRVELWLDYEQWQLRPNARKERQVEPIQ